MTKNFLLKKDWLHYAETAKVNANNWRKSRSSAWSKEERKKNADEYMLSYVQLMNRAKTAPVKIVLFYEDGRIEVLE